MKKDKEKLPKGEEKFLLELAQTMVRSYVEDALSTSESIINVPYTPPRYFKKQGKGLKILTPNQLLTRLSILLALKKAGNNSQKLNNEIRQIIYSLYSSKNMSKTVYNHLMNSI